MEGEPIRLDDIRYLRKTTPEEMVELGDDLISVMKECVDSPDRKEVVESVSAMIKEKISKGQDKQTVLNMLGAVYDAFEDLSDDKTHAAFDSRPPNEKLFVLSVNEIIRALNEDIDLRSRETYWAFVKARMDSIRFVIRREPRERR